MPSAANAAQFYPLVTNDQEFVRWAYRIALRLSNLPPNTPEHEVRRVVFGDGVPRAEWAEALVFMMNAAAARVTD